MSGPRAQEERAPPVADQVGERSAPLGGLQSDSAASRVIALQRVYGNAAVSRWLAASGGGRPLARATPELVKQIQGKEYSARFEGDTTLSKIATGAETLAKPASGLAVTKLQQALKDLGYVIAVDGTFGSGTETALKQFQSSHLTGSAATTPSGVLDADTLKALNAVYDTRKPYIDNATFDSTHPEKGTRTLSAGDKAAVHAALVPPRGASGTPAVFQDVVGGKKYGDEMRAKLTSEVDDLHKELFEDKAPLRADPTKNFYDWSVLEGAAAAAKDVTDKLYGTYASAPPMTHAAGNFIDQWEDEVARDAALNSTDKKAKARDKVWYLIASNCDDVNTKHSAVPTDPAEKAILDPIVESFVDTDAKVQRMLELDIGWEGAQLEGVVYLQRYKEATDDANREHLWNLFHVCIHEYIHSLAHPKFQAYAKKQDAIRYNTLIEGFDEFFTLTVRKTVVVDTALRKKVEGPYYDAAASVPVIHPGVYPSIAQAEQVVSIVGVRNAEAAYFRGEVDKIGGS